MGTILVHIAYLFKIATAMRGGTIIWYYYDIAFKIPNPDDDVTASAFALVIRVMHSSWQTMDPDESGGVELRTSECEGSIVCT